jgi:Tfp pilus assembly protein PilO
MDAGGFGPREWLTVIGLGITLLLFMFGQSFALWKLLSREFEKRDRAITAAASERNAQLMAVRQETVAANAQSRESIARVDKDIAALKNEFSVQLARIPTRAEMEQMLSNRVGPMEADLRSLVIELARLGVHNPDARQRG